ncbi:MAG: hypothetical protein ACLGHC_03390 [Alphaproteobacteria bacterium]
MSKRSRILGLGASIFALGAFAIVIPLTESDAQRRGGGGGRAGASMSRGGGGSFSSSRQVRSSASSSINYGSRNKVGSGSGRGSQVAGTTRPAAGSINAGNRPTTRPGNIDRGDVNINRGDVNIRRDVDIDVDVDHDWGYGDWDYRPGAVAAAAAVTTAVVVGSYYRSLPPNCVTVYRGTIVYYQCGTYWYQPVYSGMSVQYVVVNAP